MKRQQIFQHVSEGPKEWDLDDLLHPARAFESPAAVVSDADLTVNEKRAILASWASDACAIEAAPELRAAPSGRIVRFDEIMDALRTLDKQTNGDEYRRKLRRDRILKRGGRDNAAATGPAAPRRRVALQQTYAIATRFLALTRLCR
jgi:hypothetical protein